MIGTTGVAWTASAIVTLDVDGDGRDEVIAGQRRRARSLMLYTASPMASAGPGRALDEGWSAPQSGAADVNADKRVDTSSASARRP